MKKVLVLNSVCAVAILAVAGCTSSPPSIFRQFDLDSGRSISTDASQRVIINTKTHPTSRPGRVNPERIVCAEPSPDVASIVANTFGIGVNILGKGNGSFAAGQATALAQLAERTMTVQLLRDQMYRACEAYANGAIPGTEYSLLMSRNNDAMVTLMLGESASRLVGRQLATLTAEATSDASATMPDLVADTTKKKDETEKAEAELAAAKAEKETADKVVNDLPPDATKETRDQATANAAAAQDLVDEKKKAVDAAGEEEDEASEKLVKATAKNETSTDSSAGGFADGATVLNEHAVGVAELLGRMQKEYLDQGAGEHMISACIVELGNADGEVVLRNQKIYSTLRAAGATPAKLAAAGISPYNADMSSLTQDRLQDLGIRKKDAQELAESFGAIPVIDVKDKTKKMTPTDGKKRKEETIQNHAFDAYYNAENRERSSHFSRKKEIAAERLRTYVALNNQESASSLSNVCMTLLPTILRSEGVTEQQKLAFNLLVDLERIRARAKTKASEKPKDTEPKNKKKKKTASERVVEYVRCDNETAKPADIESCRIEVIDGLIRDTDVAAPGVKPESKVPHIVRFSRYKKQPAAYTGWGEILSKTGDLLKDKDPDVKKVTEGGTDYFALRADPFASKAEAEKFCKDNKDELKTKADVDCIVKKK